MRYPWYSPHSAHWEVATDCKSISDSSWVTPDTRYARGCPVLVFDWEVFFFFFFAWYWPSSLQRRGNINSISKTWRMCWLRKMALYWVRELGILEPVEKVGAQGCIVKGEQSLWVDCVLLTRRCGEWKWPWSKWLFATVLPFSAVNSQILSFLLSMGKVVSTDSSPTFWFLSTPDLHGKLPLLTYLLCLHLCTSLQYFLAEWKNSPPFHP